MFFTRCLKIYNDEVGVVLARGVGVLNAGIAQNAPPLVRLQALTQYVLSASRVNTQLLKLNCTHRASGASKVYR